jgi:hypothetical protein
MMTDSSIPRQEFVAHRVSVGVRYHDISKLSFLRRCLISIDAQSSVHPHIYIVTQDFSASSLEAVNDLLLQCLAINGSTYTLINVQNPNGLDLRTKLLNKIVQAHYSDSMSSYLCFIDYDDLWYSHALKTLLSPLLKTSFVMSYADIHLADVWTDGEIFYLRDVFDRQIISKKTKSDLLKGNFLPLHSYMFDTSKISQDLFVYDESLSRNEDYDFLIRLASSNAVTRAVSNRLIGLYNFYTCDEGAINTCDNPFDQSSSFSSEEKSNFDRDFLAIIEKNGGLHWKTFFGEDIQWPLLD